MTRPMAAALVIAALSLVLLGGQIGWRQVAAVITQYRLPASYYDPVRGRTVGIYFGSRADVSLDGTLPHEIVVAQHQGQRITRIGRDGSVIWTVSTDRNVRGMEPFGTVILFVTGSDLGAIDPVSGRVLWQTDAGGPLAGLGVTADGALLLPFSDTVPMLSAPLHADGRKAPDAVAPIPHVPPAEFARHAWARDGRIVRANTFAHRVEVWDEEDGTLLASTEAYAPTYVHQRPDGQYLIAEEHANRLLLWEAETGARRVLFGCTHPLFQNAAAGPGDIAASQARTGRDGRSVCDRRYDTETLYSPNGFSVAAGRVIYTADTDNHRVLVQDMESGAVIGAVTGFNNPIRVWAVH